MNDNHNNRRHGLPHRAHSHITGDQAVLAVRNALPARWIYREPASDYGIDCEIEVVRDDGGVTGAIVKGQVKGTASNLTLTKQGISVDADSVRYWLALPVPVVLFRVSRVPTRVLWIDVRQYLLERDRLDTVYQSKQETFFFNFKSALLLPNDRDQLEKLALRHQAGVLTMRMEGEEDVRGQFVGYIVMVRLFDGDPNRWIQWLREKGGKEQLMQDLPFAFWVKEQAEKDPDLLQRIRKMVEEYAEPAAAPKEKGSGVVALKRTETTTPDPFSIP